MSGKEEKKKTPKKAVAKSGKDDKKAGPTKAEKDAKRANYADTVEKLSDGLRRAQNSTTTTQILQNCIRYMSTRYPHPEYMKWRAASQDFKERTDVRFSDGIYMGARRFLAALEEIQLTPESRQKLWDRSRILAAEIAWSYAGQKVISAKEELLKLPAGRSHKTVDDVILKYERQELAESNLHAALLVRQERKTPKFKTNFDVVFSPELLAVMKQATRVLEMPEEQKGFLATTTMETLITAFSEFKNEKPFKALAEIMKRAAAGAYASMEEKLGDKLGTLESVQAALVKANLKFNEAKENETKLGILSDVASKNANSTAVDIEAANKAYTLAKEEAKQRRKVLTANRTAETREITSAYDIYSEMVRRRPSSLDMFNLFFRGPVAKDVPYAHSGQFKKPYSVPAAELDRVAADEIGKWEKIYNLFISAEFIVFFRTLAGAQNGNEYYFPSLGRYLEYATGFCQAVYRDSPIELVNVVLAYLLHTKTSGVLLLTGLWCKYILWRHSKKQAGYSLPLTTTWLGAMGYDSHTVDRYFAPSMTLVRFRASSAGALLSVLEKMLQIRLQPGYKINPSIPDDAALVKLAKLMEGVHLKADERQLRYANAQVFLTTGQGIPLKAKEEKESLYQPPRPRALQSVTVSGASAIALISPGPRPNSWIYPDGTLRFGFARPFSIEEEGKHAPPMEFDLLQGLTDEDYVVDCLVPRFQTAGSDVAAMEFTRHANSVFLAEIENIADEGNTLGLDPASDSRRRVYGVYEDLKEEMQQKFVNVYRFNPDQLWWDVYFPDEPDFDFSRSMSPLVARAKLAQHAGNMQITCHFQNTLGETFIVTSPDILMRIQQLAWGTFSVTSDDAKLTAKQKQDTVKLEITGRARPTIQPLTENEVDDTDDLVELADKASGGESDFDWRYHNMEFVSRAWMYRYVLAGKSLANDLMRMSWRRWDNEYRALGLRGRRAEKRDEDVFVAQQKREERRSEVKVESKAIVFRTSAKVTNENRDDFADEWTYPDDPLLKAAESAARRFAQTVKASTGITPFYLPPLPMITRVGQVLDSINTTEVVKQAHQNALIDRAFEDGREDDLERFNFRIRRIADRWSKIELAPPSAATTAYALADGLVKTFAVLKRPIDGKETKRRQTESKPDEIFRDFRNVVEALRLVALVLYYTNRMHFGSVPSKETKANKAGSVEFHLTLRDFSRALLARSRVLHYMVFEVYDPSDAEKDACLWIAEHCLYAMIHEVDPSTIPKGAYSKLVTENKDKESRSVVETRLKVLEALNVFLSVVYRLEVVGRLESQLDDEEVDVRALAVAAYLADPSQKKSIVLSALEEKQEAERDAKSLARQNDLDDLLIDAEEENVPWLPLLMPILLKGGDIDLARTMNDRWLRRADGGKIPIGKSPQRAFDRLGDVVDAVNGIFNDQDNEKARVVWEDHASILASLPPVIGIYFSSAEMRVGSGGTLADNWKELVGNLIVRWRLGERGSPNKSVADEIKRLSSGLFYLLAYFDRVSAYLNDLSTPPLPLDSDAKVQERANDIKIQHALADVKETQEEEEKEEEEEAEEEQEAKEEINIEPLEVKAPTFTFSDVDDFLAKADAAKTEEEFAEVLVVRLNDVKEETTSDVFGALLALHHHILRVGSLHQGDDIKTRLAAIRGMIQPDLLKEMRARVNTGWTAAEEDPFADRVAKRRAAFDDLRRMVIEHGKRLITADARWRAAEEKANPIPEVPTEEHAIAFGASVKPEQLSDEMKQRFAEIEEREVETVKKQTSTADTIVRINRLLARLHSEDELFALVTLQYYLSLVDDVVLVYFEAGEDPEQAALNICRVGTGLGNREDLTALQDMLKQRLVYDGAKQPVFKGLTPEMEIYLTANIAQLIRLLHGGSGKIKSEAAMEDEREEFAVEQKAKAKPRLPKRKRSSPGKAEQPKKAKVQKRIGSKKPRKAKSKGELTAQILEKQKADFEKRKAAKAALEAKKEAEAKAKPPVAAAAAGAPGYDVSVRGAGSGGTRSFTQSAAEAKQQWDDEIEARKVQLKTDTESATRLQKEAAAEAALAKDRKKTRAGGGFIRNP